MSTAYTYSALPDRTPLKWPDDNQIAVIFTINIEHWDMTHDSDAHLYAGGPSAVPYELPGTVPDYANFGWREYGQRIGIWRLIDVFDKAGVPTTCTINARTATDRGRIVDAANERGWTQTAAQVGGGAACPEAMDCQPGDGGCIGDTPSRIPPPPLRSPSS